MLVHYDGNPISDVCLLIRVPPWLHHDSDAMEHRPRCPVYKLFDGS